VVVRDNECTEGVLARPCASYRLPAALGVSTSRSEAHQRHTASGDGPHIEDAGRAMWRYTVE
jgi:hypothetical protein